MATFRMFSLRNLRCSRDNRGKILSNDLVSFNMRYETTLNKISFTCQNSYYKICYQKINFDQFIRILSTFSELGFIFVIFSKFRTYPQIIFSASTLKIYSYLIG